MSDDSFFPGACFHREIRRRRIEPGWATLRWRFCQRTRITFAETRDAQADQCRSNSLEERAGFEWILYFRLLLHASDLSAQKGSAAQQLGTGHQKRIWEIEKPKISVAALRKRPYMGSVEGSRSRWIRFTLVSGARRKVGRGIGRVGMEIGDLCRSWGRHPSAITLDAGDSHYLPSIPPCRPHQAGSQKGYQNPPAAEKEDR